MLRLCNTCVHLLWIHSFIYMCMWRCKCNHRNYYSACMYAHYNHGDDPICTCNCGQYPSRTLGTSNVHGKIHQQSLRETNDLKVPHCQKYPWYSHPFTAVNLFVYMYNCAHLLCASNAHMYVSMLHLFNNALQDMRSREHLHPPDSSTYVQISDIRVRGRKAMWTLHRIRCKMISLQRPVIVEIHVTFSGYVCMFIHTCVYIHHRYQSI